MISRRNLFGFALVPLAPTAQADIPDALRYFNQPVVGLDFAPGGACVLWPVPPPSCRESYRKLFAEMRELFDRPYEDD